MTLEFLKETLEHVLAELQSDRVKRYDWYRNIFPEELTRSDQFNSIAASRYSSENLLAVESIKHPELHNLIKQVVLRITEIGETGRFAQIWEHQEEQAGGCLARELAMYDKKYIPLYYRYIQTNDLDHEVHQMEDMHDIFHKWNYSPEIIPLLMYRGEHGQMAEVYEDYAEDVQANIKSMEDAEKYYKATLKYFEDQWGFTEDDEDDIEQVSNYYLPLFATYFGLDEEQMTRFVTEFVNRMAEEDIPTLAELVEAAK